MVIAVVIETPIHTKRTMRVLHSIIFTVFIFSVCHCQVVFIHSEHFLEEIVIFFHLFKLNTREPEKWSHFSAMGIQNTRSQLYWEYDIQLASSGTKYHFLQHNNATTPERVQPCRCPHRAVSSLRDMAEIPDRCLGRFVRCRCSSSGEGTRIFHCLSEF